MVKRYDHATNRNGRKTKEGSLTTLLYINSTRPFTISFWTGWRKRGDSCIICTNSVTIRRMWRIPTKKLFSSCITEHFCVHKIREEARAVQSSMMSNERRTPHPLSIYVCTLEKRNVFITQLSLSHRYGYMHCCKQCVCTVYAFVQLWSGKAHQIWENQTLGDALGHVRSRSNLDIPVPWSLPALPTTHFFFFFFSRRISNLSSNPSSPPF